MKENFLSYLVIFVFCRQSPPLLSYNCFCAPRSIVRNRYSRSASIDASGEVPVKTRSLKVE